MEPTLVIAAAALLGLGMVAAALLRAWEGWLAYKRRELDAVARGDRALEDARGTAPIAIADLRERIRKLEAIASGVDL
ncbi:hypothetical protein [Alteriqipengyuania lutimaris]|uniref:Uncharacterized protein n=1 Tax=Alteriqipengyuania lutimaris TaxID=1538146 RepID=A0A395LNG0_9SPHN|nr:hypothetical protein [Alteriqipengyuania lutimaris]MBB3032702.1 hypothetical protein [Alteriqipengyuania lutimaris]RDS78189.1 hypothetical protein DL238_11625 [Alteriqipengyuania lutimaris]